MANFFNGENTPGGLRKQFKALAETPDETLVLIMGNDNAAAEAADYANKICSSPESSTGLYKFVNFLTVINPDVISDLLDSLNNLTGWRTEQLVEFTIVAISPFKNNISYVVNGERFLRGRGSLDVAILQAIKNDNP